MSRALDEQRTTCPWCGEPIELLLDLSAGGQEYIEDCEVCCRPMQIGFSTDEGELAHLKVDRAD